MAFSSVLRRRDSSKPETPKVYAEFAVARKRMIQEQLVARGIQDPRVLAVMESIPRHEFVDDALRPMAYEDRPLQIGLKQTISQPYIVARMLQNLAIQPSDKVLEIGTGCGYQTALLAGLAVHVYSIERLSDLILKARRNLKKLHLRNITLKLADGTLGWEMHAPFDCLVVAAAGPQIPEPYLRQLAEGGRMVLPVGSETKQELILVRKQFGRIHTQVLEDCRFVKLKGKNGFEVG